MSTAKLFIVVIMAVAATNAESQQHKFVSLEEQSLLRARRFAKDSIEDISTLPTTTVEAAEDGNNDDGGGQRGYMRGEFVGEVLGDVDVPEGKINETIESHKNKEYNMTKELSNKYYKSVQSAYKDTWVDLDRLNATQGIVKEHPMLSKSYRRAATIQLSFPFPFYGHEVQNITIATGGFLYTGQYVHSWLAATQYIAPLMANFDTSQDESAKIRYADNGTALIVEWSNVTLQSGNNATTGGNVGDNGPFTFQVVLHDDGDIAFSYTAVPRVIKMIKDEEHPVKVGLSDAYIIDRTIFFVRRKTIYEYHRVDLKEIDIDAKSAIYFEALETCNRKTSCEECLGDQSIKLLGCKWCPRLNKCSDGVDRTRQHWLKKGCEHYNLNEVDKCGNPLIGVDDGHRRNDDYFNHPDGDLRDHFSYDNGELGQGIGDADHGDQHKEKLTEQDALPSASHAGVAFMAILALLVAATIAWFGYAYFFPNSWSGRLLIKYRPSRWHWFRSEPRYSAASIHM